MLCIVFMCFLYIKLSEFTITHSTVYSFLHSKPLVNTLVHISADNIDFFHITHTFLYLFILYVSTAIKLETRVPLALCSFYSVSGRMPWRSIWKQVFLTVRDPSLWSWFMFLQRERPQLVPRVGSTDPLAGPARDKWKGREKEGEDVIVLI